jgi:hypothetical protein
MHDWVRKKIAFFNLLMFLFLGHPLNKTMKHQLDRSEIILLPHTPFSGKDIGTLVSLMTESDKTDT